MTFTESRTASGSGGGSASTPAAGPTDRVRSLEPRLTRSRIDVDSGTGYEALLGLMIFAGHQPPGEYAVGADWYERMHARATPALAADVAELCGDAPTVFGHLLGLVRQSAEPRDLAALIDLVAGLPPARLRLELLGCSAASVQAGIPPAVLERAGEGDQAATEELLAAAADDRGWSRNVRTVLAMSPECASALTLRVLRGWADAFAQEEARLGRQLTAQAERWRVEAGQLGWREVVEQATGGIVLDADLPADYVLLVPTVLGAPWVYSTEVHRTKIFCCPVRESAGTGVAELVPVFRALADETRLTILQLLAAAGPTTLAQLTAQLGISKSAVHKHLMLLRSAGLIRLNLGRDRRYALRELPDLGAALRRAIGPLD